MSLKYFVLSNKNDGTSNALNYLYNNMPKSDILILSTLEDGCDYHKYYEHAWVIIIPENSSREEKVEICKQFSKNNEFESIIILDDNSILTI